MRVLLPLLGAAVLAVTLADIFFTVLFPASGHGPLRRPLSRLVWRSFRAVATRLGEDRGRRWLGYCGPVLVGVSIAVWPTLLVIGWALVFYPALGHGLVASSGPTAQTWTTALYFSGFSLTTLGTGDVVPATGLYRVLTVVEAGIGFATVSMVVTYFLSLYSAVTQRRTFAAALHHRTQDTGDGARLVAALGGQGGLSEVLSELASAGGHVERMFQTHQSYPVVRYFHHRQTRYALPRILLVALDAAALVPSALAGTPRPLGADAPAVALVHGAALDLLQELVPDRAERAEEPGDEARWRARAAQALDLFRQAGLDVREAGAAADEYVRRRRGWEGRLRALAAATLYDWAEIDPEGSVAGGRGERSGVGTSPPSVDSGQ